MRPSLSGTASAHEGGPCAAMQPTPPRNSRPSPPRSLSGNVAAPRVLRAIGVPGLWLQAGLKRFRRAKTHVSRWQQRSSERRMLSLMREHEWRDMGLTRDRVRQEISKPFWRA